MQSLYDMYIFCYKLVDRVSTIRGKDQLINISHMFL